MLYNCSQWRNGPLQKIAVLTLLFNRNRWTRTKKSKKKRKKQAFPEIEFVDKIIFGIQDLWKGVRYLLRWFWFVRLNHAIRKLFKRFSKSLSIMEISTLWIRGWYSVSDEEYFTETQLVEVYRDAEGNMIAGLRQVDEVELVKEESLLLQNEQIRCSAYSNTTKNIQISFNQNHVKTRWLITSSNQVWKI